jgi:hypothetical protein
VAMPLSKHSQPRGHGSGSRLRRSIPRRASPPRSLTVEVINPTRSARTPHVASSRRSADWRTGVVGVTLVTP